MSVSFHTRDVACVAARVILRFLTVIALFLRASCVICDECVVMRATAFATVQHLVSLQLDHAHNCSGRCSL